MDKEPSRNETQLGAAQLEEIRKDMTFVPAETLEQVIAVAMPNGARATSGGSEKGEGGSVPSVGQHAASGR